MRLKERRLIRPLFDRSRNDAHTLARGSVRLVYRIVPRDELKVATPLKVGVAPGRGLRRAVDRNQVKRHLREAFRLNQESLRRLFEQRDDTLTMMILYRSGLPVEGPTIQMDTKRALEALHNRLSPGTSNAAG